MANRLVGRTYGALDDPSARQRSSPELVGPQSTASLSNLHDAGVSEHSHRGYSRRSWLTVAVISAMAVGTVMTINRSKAPTITSPSPEDSSSRESGFVERLPKGAIRQPEASNDRLSVKSLDEALVFSMTNFYHTRDGKPGRLIPWLQNVQLAEPHRETTMKVENARDGHSYEWEVRQVDQLDNAIASATGAEATIIFPKLDWNTVTLKEKDASDNVTREYSENVMVKYVRREIRTLTDEEREELFDSMAKLWRIRVKGGTGKEIYGNDYADIWAINRLHFLAASDYTCDHFHDGLGFMTSHSLLTNTFEYSLQIVNPKLTVPYWDFTIEASTWGGNTEEVTEPQANSPLFTSEWFGTNDPDDLQLKDSRWGRTAIPRVEVNNPANLEVDVYSKLRAPWNVNDRPYLTRSMGDMCGTRVEEKYQWPNCNSHYDLITQYDDFYTYVWTSLYDPHGPVHIWLGGVVDCDETFDKIAELTNREVAREMSYYSFVYRKNLWRSGYFRCSGSAEVDESPGAVLESGTCGCLDFDLKSGDDYETILPTMIFMESFIGDYDEDTQRAVIDTLCNGLSNDGDHLQASSSLDPSFWSTHPTMERLYMFKRLTGTMTDLTWPDSETTVVDPETGETTREITSLYGDCNGHGGSDVFPFGLAVDSGDPGFKARTAIKGDEEGGNSLTNREVLLALDPRVNSLSYIYDTFDWPHCMQDGLDFNDAWPADHTKVSTHAPKEGANRPRFKDGDLRYPMYSAFREKSAKIAEKYSPSKL